MPRIWDTWLPPPVALEVKEDRSRFAAVAQSLEKAVHDAQEQAATNPDAWHSLVIPWIPILNNFTESKTTLDTPDVLKAIEALWLVVHNCSLDLEVQVRSCDVCVELMRSQKKELAGRLELPWEPLFKLLQQHFDNPAPRLEGMGLTSTRQMSLQRLASKARRYFAPGTAAALWTLLGPQIHSTNDTEAYLAVCYIVLFMPTNDASCTDTALLNANIAEWMRCWGLVSGSAHWDSLWMRLFSRTAKHDRAGRINWEPHLSQLFTYMMGVFEVPVGNATGSSPVAHSPPHKPAMLFSSLMSGEVFNVAGCIMYLLRSPAGKPSPSSTKTLSNFLHMVNLLEQYFHPSNTGKWSACLSELLKELVSLFAKQLADQAENPGDDRAVLTEDVQKQVLEATLKLAARGQFSKNSSLARASCRSLAKLAYISPSTVLPLVVRRFRSSLETSTATHQLANSISTMALCVRPILMSGWSPEEETAEQLLAEAMMALLPGIDANDETKTSSVLHFYTMVLSSVSSLGADEGEGGSREGLRLPLYVDEWAEELMNRLLALLYNLDTGPGHRADQASGKGDPGGGASFLSAGSNDMLMHLCDLLFLKLPVDVCEILIERLAKFALSSVLPTVVQDVCTICSQAVSHHPMLVMKLLVKPLMKSIKAELPEKGSGGTPSQSLESTLGFQIGLLQQLLGRFYGEELIPICKEVEVLVQMALEVPSRPVQARGASLLTSVMFALVHSFDAPNALSATPYGPNGVELWVDKEGEGFQPPRWSAPSPAQLQLAEELLERHLLGSCDELVATCRAEPQDMVVDGPTDSTHAQKMKLNALIAKIRAMLTGLQSHMKDFEFSALAGGVASGAVPVGMVGCQQALVGPVGVGEKVAEKLAEACRLLSNQDPDILSGAMSACGLLLCNGLMEYSGSRTVRSQIAKLIELLAEPPVAGLLQGGKSFKKRVPRWLAEMRVGYSVQWRCSQAAFRGGVTSACPTLSELPPAYCALLSEICTLGLHRYNTVRDGALPIVDACCKRFPVLVRFVMPQFLAGMADIQCPDLLRLIPNKEELAIQESKFFSRLSSAATNGPSPAAVAAEAESSSVGSDAGGTESERDGRVLGSCRVFQGCLSFWRAIFRQRPLFVGMQHAAMASRAYPGVRAQTQLGNLLVQMTARFLHPPSLDCNSPEYTALSSQLLALAKPGAAATRGGGRYILIANVLVLLTMPQQVLQPVALPFTEHLLEMMESELLPLRQLASTGLTFQLSCIAEYGQANSAIVSTVAGWLASKDCGERLMSHIVLAHTRLDVTDGNRDKKGGDGMSRLMSMNFEEMITRVVKASIQNTIAWPEDEMKPAAINSGLFVVQHAKLVQLLCRLAPQQTLAAFRAPLEARVTPELCVKISNTSEKAELAASAEVLSGLLSSGHTFNDGDYTSECNAGGDSTAWVFNLVDVALRSTTLELAGSWALAVRYGLKGLLEASNVSVLPPIQIEPPMAPKPQKLGVAPLPQVLGSLRSLLRLLVGGQTATSLPAGVGAELPSTMKKMKYMHACVVELRGYRSCHSDTPPEVRTFWAAVLDNLKRLLSTDSVSLREQLGALLAEVLSFFGTDGPSLRAAVAAAAASAQGEESPSTGSTNSPVLVEPHLAEGGEDSPPVEIEISGNGSAVLLLHTGVTHLRRQAHQLAVQVTSDFARATQMVAASRTAVLKQGPSGSTAGDDVSMADASVAGAGDGMGLTDEGAEGLLSQLGVGLQLIVCGLKHGDLVALRELLVVMMPQLFSLQELAGPALQKLNHEAQLAFVMIKYLDLAPHNMEAVVAATSATGAAELWSSRAAGLLYLQYVWWRQCFLMSPSLTQKLEDVVVERLPDSKAEVRHIAAATLSGMVKGMADDEAAKLRCSIIAKANAAMGSAGARKRSKSATGGASQANEASLLEKQGIVQGLKAFLLSSPYECPPWVPEVLVALFPAAGAGQGSAQLRADASKALSEFKRTHEQESIDELRAMLDYDQWDTYQEATSSASYFA